MASPKAQSDLLDRPDGSASYSFNGYSVLAAVNGPVEVQRRDELPEEAAIDVVVRPASGVGAIRERYFESIVHSVLRRAIHTKAHPRTLIQVTVQVLSTPSETASIAALLALLTASIPMQMTFAATGLVVDRENNLQLEPSPRQVHDASSIHVFCYSNTGTMLLYLSEGPVSARNLAAIEEQGRTACIGGPALKPEKGVTEMDLDGASTGQAGFIRQTVLERLEKHESWRLK